MAARRARIAATLTLPNTPPTPAGRPRSPGLAAPPPGAEGWASCTLRSAALPYRIACSNSLCPAGRAGQPAPSGLPPRAAPLRRLAPPPRIAARSSLRPPPPSPPISSTRVCAATGRGATGGLRVAPIRRLAPPHLTAARSSLRPPIHSPPSPPTSATPVGEATGRGAAEGGSGGKKGGRAGASAATARGVGSGLGGAAGRLLRPALRDVWGREGGVRACNTGGGGSAAGAEMVCGRSDGGCAGVTAGEECGGGCGGARGWEGRKGAAGEAG